MKNITLLIAVLSAVVLSGCQTDANVASRNLSIAAGMFEIDRRIVFYNGITGEYILTIEGKCSIDANGVKLAVTCKTGSNEYKKHYLGLSDNVTYFSEQVIGAGVSVYRYKVIFRPSAIIPDIDIKI